MYFFKKVRRIGLPYLVFAGVSIFFHIFAGALLAGGVWHFSRELLIC